MQVFEPGSGFPKTKWIIAVCKLGRACVKVALHDCIGTVGCGLELLDAGSANVQTRKSNSHAKLSGIVDESLKADHVTAFPIAANFNAHQAPLAGSDAF